jgi:hypothetical protein
MEIKNDARLKQLKRLALKLKPGYYSLTSIAKIMCKDERDYRNVFQIGMIQFLKDIGIIYMDGSGEKFKFDREKLWKNLKNDSTLGSIHISVDMPKYYEDLTYSDLDSKTWECDF